MEFIVLWNLFCFIQITICENLKKECQCNPYLLFFMYRPCVNVSFLSLLFLLVKFINLCIRGLEWWWDHPIIHHVYRWPRFGCWRPRRSSCEKIATGHGCCTNRTTQALSLSLTCYHQLQVARWCGSLQSRSE